MWIAGYVNKHVEAPRTEGSATVARDVLANPRRYLRERLPTIGSFVPAWGARYHDAIATAIA